MSDTTKAPTKMERDICWQYRDQYFHCLDQLTLIHPVDKRTRLTEQGTLIIDPLDISPCESFRASFSKHCPTSWYQYFLKKRERDILSAQRQSELEKKNAKSASTSSWF